MMWKRIDGMRTLGLGPRGPFRDELNALVLEGKKTATAGVWRVDYEPDGEDVEAVGERLVLLDSDGRRSGVVEVTRVESHRFADVPWELARDEGEGFTSIEDFRSGYRRHYHSTESVAIADDDLTICVWFVLVEVP